MNKNSGFTKFPNALLEKLMSSDLTVREYKVILSVIRQTLGYHKESEELSLSQLSELTGCKICHISKTIRQLIERKILVEIEKPEFNTCRTIALNDDISQWFCKKVRVPEKVTETVAEKGRVTVPEKVTHTSYIKENNKEIYKYKKNVLKNEKKPSYDLELFERMINSKD